MAKLWEMLDQAYYYIGKNRPDRSPGHSGSGVICRPTEYGRLGCLYPNLQHTTRSGRVAQPHRQCLGFRSA